MIVNKCGLKKCYVVENLTACSRIYVWRSGIMGRKSLGVFARKRAVKVFLGQSVHF